ncbi:MAG: tyrosine-type recombinase/integrase [Pseudomonadota bacterium]
MNARSLNSVVDNALAEIGLDPKEHRKPSGQKRSTKGLGTEPGFGIRQYPSGRSVYIVQARMGGRGRTVTIGNAAVLSQTQAARIARLVLAEARVGGDPVATKQRVKGAPLFEDFLEEYWERWSPRWTSKTRRENFWRRRDYLESSFAGLGIDEIDEVHVTHWFRSLNDRTTPGAANMAIAILSHMFNKAEDWGYRLDHTNPCCGVKRNRRKHYERVLSVSELNRLGEVLANERQSPNLTRALPAYAATLLLLTGCRRGEILGLQWDDIKGKRVHLRSAKTGPRTVWLSQEAHAVIKSIPRQRGIKWLFWNPGAGKPIKDFTLQWHSIRAKAGLCDVRLHDLRHSFASHAAMNKETLPMIGRLLGHAQLKSTSRYTHLDAGHILDAAERIGAAIEKMLDG